MKYILLFLVVAFYAYSINAQEIGKLVIDENQNGEKLHTLLEEIENRYNVDFLHELDVMEALTITGVSQEMYLSNFIDVFLGPYSQKLVKAQDNVYFIVNDSLRWQYGKNSFNYIAFQLKDSTRQTIRGIIKDNDTNEPIVGAQVTIQKGERGVVTNSDGYFEINVPLGIYQVEVRYVGFEINSFLAGFSEYGSNSVIERHLFPTPMELEGVTITAEGSDRNVKALVPGVEKMGIDEIKKLPTFLGEVDPVKNLIALPGISTVGELSSGFNVRGGDTGQNLIVQDGAIIYNPSHLFGFFSAFNPDFLQDVTLYKGGGPAKFGGRISSVLDIKLRNGDATKHTVSGGAGLVSSRLGLEGPIVKNKLSYLIGGRISYTNWLLKATDNIQLQNSSTQFYDITAKVFNRFNKNNFLSVTGYRSYDEFHLASDSTFSWQTTNASLNWDHHFSSNLVSTLNLSSSNYYSEIFNRSEIDAFVYRNEINSLWLKYDFVLKNEMSSNYNFGIDVKRTFLEPGQRDPAIEGSNALPIDIQDQNVLETAAYLEGDYNLSDKWAVSIGLRYSHFFRLGEDVIYSFDFNKMQGRYPTITKSTRYDQGDLIEDYGGVEPRISVRYLVNEVSSIKLSYFRSNQYLHLITNTTSVTPQDYWVASSPYLRPEIGDQISAGYFQNLSQDEFEISIEAYYKKVSNAVDYIDGADLSLNPALEAGLMNGRGLAYGLEVLARKNTGKLNGWISYTYSRSFRQFKSENQVESINDGEYYPASYDQPHNLSVILNYRLSPRTTVSSNFSYSTGRPITIPISKYSYDPYLAVLNFSDRNEYRIPDYHRLDLSMTIESIQRKNSKFHGEWVFSIFNVYSRNNAYSIFFNRYGTAKKLSILGSVFPSITYNFKF